MMQVRGGNACRLRAFLWKLGALSTRMGIAYTAILHLAHGWRTHRYPVDTSTSSNVTTWVLMWGSQAVVYVQLQRQMLQARVRRIYPHAYVLGLLLYSDATEVNKKGHKFHPLNLYIANFRLDAMRSARGYRRLALLPILSAQDFPTLSRDRYSPTFIMSHM